MKTRVCGLIWIAFLGGLIAPVQAAHPSDVILFESITYQPIGTSDIYAIHSDGTGLRQLTLVGTAYEPVWSPSGQEVAFLNSEAEGRILSSIEILHLTTNEVRQVVDAQAILEPGISSPVLSGPAWSPDGQAIAFLATFQSDECDQVRTSDLYVIQLEDGNIERLTHTCAFETNLDWHPGGRAILYMSDMEDGERSDKYYIYVHDLEEGITHFLGNPLPPPIISPQWAPNGEHIIAAAFLADWQFFILDTDTEDFEPWIDYHPEFDRLQDFDVSWDMQKVVFAASNEDQDREIFVYDVLNSTLFQITDDDVDDISPSWRPAPPMGNE